MPQTTNRLRAVARVRPNRKARAPKRQTLRPRAPTKANSYSLTKEKREGVNLLSFDLTHALCRLNRPERAARN
jgi:hypothetical protein